MPDQLTHCPECQLSLEGIDPRGHALSHWPEFLEPRESGTEARERQAALLAEADRREEEARDQRANPVPPAQEQPTT